MGRLGRQEGNTKVRSESERRFDIDRRRGAKLTIKKSYILGREIRKQQIVATLKTVTTDDANSV